jgi:hypothetical protein
MYVLYIYMYMYYVDGLLMITQLLLKGILFLLSAL